VTGPDGSYTFPSLVLAPDGTLEATKDGFEGFSDTFSVKDRLPRFDVMIAPTMTPGSLRFILSWGQKPNDLDIHLTTPNAGCKISYQNKQCNDAKQNVNLDVDVTGGYGPETITVTKPMDGTYRFYVHMYSADQLGWSKTQAVVRVLHKRTNGLLTIHTYDVYDDISYFTSAAFDPNGPKLDMDAPAARYWNVFAFLHTDAKGVGTSLVASADLFTPDGAVSTGSKLAEPTPPPVPPPTARPSSVPSRTPTVTPTDSPKFPETHLPSKSPTLSPTDAPVNLNGIVKSALNGLGVAGVTLVFTTGPNLGKSAVSGADGSYTFTQLQGAPDGTLSASKAGLETWSSTFSIKNRLPRLDIMVVPTMNPGQIRIVLSWGATPPDLDVHLLTPKGCEIWYNNLRCTNGENVQLDTDATNGFGPETITFNQVAQGAYKFQVHKYSASHATAIKDSQAVVQVLRKADVGGQLTISTCKASDASSWTARQDWSGAPVAAPQAIWWNVFEYNTINKTVTPQQGSGCSTIVI